MNLKTRILLASLCLFLTVHSQINIQYGQTDRYLFSTKEALNFTAISMATKAINVQFHGRITAQSGVVVEFKSATVLVNPGANMYSPVNLALSSTDFINQDIAEIERMTGTWPSGDYKLCIWSVCATGDCDGAGQNAGSTEQPACTNIHIENPTPLLLSYPSDNSEIDETRPNYNWIPPAPVAASGSLNYTMTLVEILDGQSKSDALALNRPLIEWPGITNPMLMHPSDIPDLEPGKSYAWQVQAYIGQTYFAKSEQWKFKVKKLEKKKEPKQAVFLKLVNDPYVYNLKMDSLYIGLTKLLNTTIEEGITVIYKTAQGKVLSQSIIQFSSNNELGYFLLKISREELERNSINNFVFIEIIGVEGQARFLKVQL